MKKQYVGACTGKSITFKELKDLYPSAPASTARVTSPAPADSDSEDITHAMNRVNTHFVGEEFGFDNYTLDANVATFTVNRVINKETFPKYNIMKQTEFVKDKSCVMCFKSDMNLYELSRHMERKHSLTFEEDDIIQDELDDWIYVAEKWNTQGLVYVESDNESIESYHGEQQPLDSDPECIQWYI